MGFAHFHLNSGNGPDAAFEIELRPLGPTKFTRANENVRS